ncbi:cell wall biogenesis protein Ecm15 [Penicillium macrosclerotiorum]|uniref:cell wall biogenesis protein Ecm15 n=1 Tax=Penicillium macrosclerotiorum TaxID=303699 RepID=UPI002547F06E|nr:cell wall biogenesis protein Ecm15 [Penicillium macrosclerotiorum]KAJ5693193.1 cell wall biogenesis protein Ecm15 [Penicillium macrosclerotiorum]
MDTNTLPTPAHCTADFCLIPIGTGSASVSAQIADVQRLIEQSGVKYVMHSAGTTLGRFLNSPRIKSRSRMILPADSLFPSSRHTEGPWDRVHQVIGQAHTLLHQQGIVRIQTDIRVGSRTDKEQSFEDKVNKVRQLLSQDSK